MLTEKSCQIYKYLEKRKIYTAQDSLRGTNVFVSEDISATQRSLFYQCRQLRKIKAIKDTWTQELSIYVRSHDGEKTLINSEAGLALWKALEPVPSQTTIPPTPPRCAPEFTPYRTPRPSTARSLFTDSDSSFHSFNTLDAGLY